MERSNNLVYNFAKSQFGNLRHVRRFTGCYLNHQESVAEHHWYVSLLVNLIVTDYNMNLPKGRAPLHLGVALQRAIMHDIEEGVTGDFPRPFKYSDPELKRQLDVAASKGCKSMLASLKLDELQTFEHQTCWENAKREDREGAVVGFADLVAFLEFVWREVRSGNNHIVDYTSEVYGYLAKFEAERYDVIHCYLAGAWALYHNILEEAGIGREGLGRSVYSKYQAMLGITKFDGTGGPDLGI